MTVRRIEIPDGTYTDSTDNILIPLNQLDELSIYRGFDLEFAPQDIATSGKQFLSDIEEVAQTVTTRLRLFLGEYFRDITDGTPWFEQVLGKGSSLEGKEAAIKNRIVRTGGVTQLTSFSTDFNINTRTYTVNAGILTPFGTTQIIVTDVI